MAQEVKFLDMFGCCAALRDKCGGLELAKVKNVVVSREKRTMDIAAGFAAPGTPSDIAMLEWRIAAEYGFTRVKITGNTPAAAPAEKKAAPPKKEAKPAPKKAESGDVLFGKLPKDNHRTDISELTLQSGTVSVTGKVFAMDSRKIQKTNAAVLSFDMTDYTGSIHVSKYIRQGDDQSILDKIRVGDYLTVRGDVIFNRYDNDMAIDVAAIAKETAPQRQDTAEGDKRVELHLHTRYSTLDALTDPTAAVKTAARWGHRAIAVTDHGVAQAFPEVLARGGASAASRSFTDVEGYYINDVDDRLAVHGEQRSPAQYGDCVGFDIETTGLDSRMDRITEIGAVRVENGVVIEELSTRSSNPGMPIPPEIVQLTGITDRDVYRRAGRGGGRARCFWILLAISRSSAHNAAFDIGFITAAAKRSGLAFDRRIHRYAPNRAGAFEAAQKISSSTSSPTRWVCRTLTTTARATMPPCAPASSQPSARGSRTRAQKRSRMPERSWRSCAKTTPAARVTSSLLVQNKAGLKNLYELISRSHLEHFKKSPSHSEEPPDAVPGGAPHRLGVRGGRDFRRRRAQPRAMPSLTGSPRSTIIWRSSRCATTTVPASTTAKSRDEEDLREFNRRVLALGTAARKARSLPPATCISWNRRMRFTAIS